jgi:hypothetical protein
MTFIFGLIPMLYLGHFFNPDCDNKGSRRPHQFSEIDFVKKKTLDERFNQALA